MRRSRLVLTLVAAAACSGKSAEKVDSTTPPAAVAAPAPAANTKADEDSIRAISARISKAMTAGDAAAVADTYADDAVDYTPGMAPARGRAALAKEYADIFGQMRGMKASFGPPDVMVAQSGDLALSRVSYEFSFTDPKGKPAAEHGNAIIGWKKVNGVWKVAASMNAPEPAAPGK